MNYIHLTASAIIAHKHGCGTQNPYVSIKKKSIRKERPCAFLHLQMRIEGNRKKKKSIRKWFLVWLLALVVVVLGVILVEGHKSERETGLLRAQMSALYGENQPLEAGQYDPELAVTCHNGTFVGRETDGVRAYKGIPYAEPPVGKLRWKRPVLAKENDGTYEAYYFGKSCIQTEAESERASFYAKGEDCLTLNVWSGSRKTAKDRPVMVFFPGGAFGWGGTADPLYDGHNFVHAHDDVILVTVNYRVGLMGFMDFSSVKGGEEFEGSGNLGLLDQVCALRWIRENIRQFGGDPENVTIFGESAGGSSVSLLPLMDDAKGLFKRIIAQSGSPAFTYSREECRLLTDKLLEKTGAKSMDDLMALSEEELMKINEDLNNYNNFPERDGIILPEDLQEAYASGRASDVDMLIGTNADEARYWIGEVGSYHIYRAAVPLFYESIVNQISDEDRGYARAFLALQREDVVWNITEFLNDLLFRVPAVSQASAHARNGGNTYMYYWTRESDIPHYGACHAVELAYVFGNVDDTIYTGEAAEEELSRTIQQMWVNFAKTSDPGTAEHPWEQYDEQNRQTMLLGNEIRMIQDPMKEQRVLIEPLMKYHFNGNYMVADYALRVLLRDILLAVLILLGVEAAIYVIYRVVKGVKELTASKRTG